MPTTDNYLFARC